MKNLKIIFVFLHTILYPTVSTKSTAKDAEVEVKLQFLEYELQDFCMSRNEAEWKFMNGTDHDLNKLLGIEMKESDLYKYELEILQKHTGNKFHSEKLERLLNVFSHPGAPLLDSMEFKEYRDYSIKLQELSSKMTINCDAEEGNERNSEELIKFNNSDADEKCNSINYNKINEILFIEKNESKLKNLWTNWYRELGEKNKRTRYDFVQQLSILDLEAEQNGEEELTEYWLKQSDITWVNYDICKNLWNEIQPLYEKLKDFITSLISQKFGKNVFQDQKLIPAHILGSLQTHDWVTAAETLGALEHSNAYREMKSFLEQKNVQAIYKAADNLTAELQLGHLPKSFYEKSSFNESSQTCQNKIMQYCERDNILRAMSCKNAIHNIKQYIDINENVMRMKYLILSGKEEADNGYLFREGPRESVLYDAMDSLSSLRALWPKNLKMQNLLINHTQEDVEMLTLFISALHVIPALPYYLASDLWRINALQEIDAAVGENTDDMTATPLVYSTSKSYHDVKPEPLIVRDKEQNGNNSSINRPNISEKSQPNNGSAEGVESSKIYDAQNLTRDWWTYREKFQGIGSPDGKLYEDYLLDEKIIWNKPYLSKFLGKILQFQILEYIKSENISDDKLIFQKLLLKGKSKPWEILAAETFNITEISAKPLLKYFKPLEEFLDKGMKIKNQTGIFSFDDFSFVSQGFSLNPTNGEDEGEKPAEGSDALFFSLAVIAAVGVVAIIVTIGRRRYKKRQRARERKRKLAEL